MIKLFKHLKNNSKSFRVRLRNPDKDNKYFSHLQDLKKKFSMIYYVQGAQITRKGFCSSILFCFKLFFLPSLQLCFLLFRMLQIRNDYPGSQLSTTHGKASNIVSLLRWVLPKV